MSDKDQSNLGKMLVGLGSGASTDITVEGEVDPVEKDEGESKKRKRDKDEDTSVGVGNKMTVLAQPGGEQGQGERPVAKKKEMKVIECAFAVSSPTGRPIIKITQVNSAKIIVDGDRELRRNELSLFGTAPATGKEGVGNFVFEMTPEIKGRWPTVYISDLRLVKITKIEKSAETIRQEMENLAKKQAEDRICQKMAQLDWVKLDFKLSGRGPQSSSQRHYIFVGANFADTAMAAVSDCTSMSASKQPDGTYYVMLELGNGYFDGKQQDFQPNPNDPDKGGAKRQTMGGYLTDLGNDCIWQVNHVGPIT